MKIYDTPIIPSILWTDLYKLTMQHAVRRLYPGTKARFTFINRGKTPFPPGFAKNLKRQLVFMSELKLTPEMAQWMSTNLPFLPRHYITEILGTYQFDPNEVEITQKGTDLQITIEGLWYKTILWETPLMCVISTLYNIMMGHKVDSGTYARAKMKGRLFHTHNIFLAELGTRRSFSPLVHQRAYEELFTSGGTAITGTSNVQLAMDTDTKAIGTQAHEWYQAHAALFGYRQANIAGLNAWTQVYGGMLGIALPDTFTTPVFLKTFGAEHARLFDGVRHDSGDPKEFTRRMMMHYDHLGINPQTKSIIYSDGIKNFDHLLDLHEFAEGLKVPHGFGSGTWITNDTGFMPLNMVIKMSHLKVKPWGWIPTIKLSDSPGKETGNRREIELAKYQLGLE